MSRDAASVCSVHSALALHFIIKSQKIKLNLNTAVAHENVVAEIKLLRAESFAQTLRNRVHAIKVCSGRIQRPFELKLPKLVSSHANTALRRNVANIGAQYGICTSCERTNAQHENTHLNAVGVLTRPSCKEHFRDNMGSLEYPKARACN